MRGPFTVTGMPAPRHEVLCDLAAFVAEVAYHGSIFNRVDMDGSARQRAEVMWKSPLPANMITRYRTIANVFETKIREGLPLCDVAIAIFEMELLEGMLPDVDDDGKTI